MKKEEKQRLILRCQQNIKEKIMLYKPEDSCNCVSVGRKAVRPGVFTQVHIRIVKDMRTIEMSEISLPFNPLKPPFILHIKAKYPQS